MSELTNIEINDVQQVTETAAIANANQSPEDIAANFFKAYYPTYKLLVGKLNKKDAVRLADALVAWPLEIDNPKFFNDEAKRAFWIANQLIDCKLIMRSAVEIEQMQNSVDESVTAEEPVVLNNDAVNEGENNNG